MADARWPSSPDANHPGHPQHPSPVPRRRNRAGTVPAGCFVMGSDEQYPEERPAHEEHVSAFLIEKHPVTNAEFRRFVKDTNDRTTAEIVPSAEDFPDADPGDLTPGSLVFRPTPGPVPPPGRDLRDAGRVVGPDHGNHPRVTASSRKVLLIPYYPFWASTVTSSTSSSSGRLQVRQQRRNQHTIPTSPDRPRSGRPAGEQDHPQRDLQPAQPPRRRVALLRDIHHGDHVINAVSSFDTERRDRARLTFRQRPHQAQQRAPTHRQTQQRRSERRILVVAEQAADAMSRCTHS